MKIKFHGDKSNILDLKIGDLLRFVDVTGRFRQGILVEIEECRFPRQGIVNLILLENGVLNKMDTNRIFKCRKVT